MKKVQNCVVENCIPTPTSCSEWNGGEISYLGICNGESLNNVIWEIIIKLEAITGTDLSNFDIDSLLDICNKKAPAEITILSILNILKDNNICLKDYITTLQEEINALNAAQNVNVNLKCFADFDNLGNSLSISREALDQLVINRLCIDKDDIQNIQGDIIVIKNEILDIQNQLGTGEESVATCVNGNELPVSQQLINTSAAHCDLEDATGTSTDIGEALANTPDWSTVMPTLLSNQDYISNPLNWADSYNNVLLAFNNIILRVTTIENTCCQITCDDIELGFSATYDEAGNLVIAFSSAAGTSIPVGFIDSAPTPQSTITITDSEGTPFEYNFSISNNFINNEPDTFIITGLVGDLIIDISSKLSNGVLTCQGCLSKTLKENTNCCELTNMGSTPVVVIYTVPSSI